MSRLKSISFTTTFLFLILNSYLLAQSADTEPDALRIGLTGSAPFVYDDPENPTGIAVEIWEDLAKEQDWNYTYQSFDEVSAALTALTKGELDIVVGPIKHYFKPGGTYAFFTTVLPVEYLDCFARRHTGIMAKNKTLFQL